MDRRLPRGRLADAFGGLFDLSGGAEHAAGGPRARPWCHLNNPAPAIRERDGSGDGHPARLPLLRDPADRLSDGPRWAGRPGTARRRRLSRRLGQAIPGDLATGGQMSETLKTDGGKLRLVGINHIAIEVGDIDEALDFYGKIFDFTLRAKRPGNAFIELGDQFINMMQTADPHEDRRRHFGLVVDDRSSVRARVEAAGGKLLPGPFLAFLDPWGNRVEVVEYANIQFTKAPQVLHAMGFDLDKNENARRELAEKGMAS